MTELEKMVKQFAIGCLCVVGSVILFFVIVMIVNLVRNGTIWGS